MKVFLPYPPSANERLTRAKGRKGFVNTAKYRSWKEEAAWVVAMAVRESGGIKGDYRLGLRIMPPPLSRGRDIDNLIKATSDALKDGGMIENDSRCQALFICWGRLDSPGALCRLQPCRKLLSLAVGSDKSPSKPQSRHPLRRSRTDATIPAARIGGHSATGSPAKEASASQHSSTSAESIACPSRKRNEP